MQAIRDNKEAELLKGILDIDKPVPRHERMRERSHYLRKSVEKLKKHEEKMEARRLRAIERAKRKI